MYEVCVVKAIPKLIVAIYKYMYSYEWLILYLYRH